MTLASGAAYTVVEAADCLAADTAAKLSPEQAKRLATTPLNGAPIQGVARYVSLHEPASSDITSDELVGILDAGLGLWLVQHVYAPGWRASALLGAQLGMAAKAHAHRVGYLPGAHLALDLEGCSSVGDAVTEYVEAWCVAVRDIYQPLLYVGYAAGLSPEKLYLLGGVALYWSDYGPRMVAKRNFAIKQHAQVNHCGIPIDPDTVGADQLGGRLRWMKRVETPQDAPSEEETKNIVALSDAALSDDIPPTDPAPPTENNQ